MAVVVVDSDDCKSAVVPFTLTVSLSSDRSPSFASSEEGCESSKLL